MGVMAEDDRQVLNAHGAKRLPSVEVDSYNLEIKDEDAENIRTVSDAVQYIDEHSG